MTDARLAEARGADLVGDLHCRLHFGGVGGHLLCSRRRGPGVRGSEGRELWSEGEAEREGAREGRGGEGEGRGQG